MKQLIRHQSLLVLMALVVFFTGLGRYPLFNEDESRNATCGAEMFRRADWIVPTFNNELRTDKPILVYWLMLASNKLFGISEFSARFASSFLSIGTTLLTWHLGRRLYSANVGFLAAVILCTCLLFSAVGRAATPDATLVFLVTFAFASYVWVVARQRGGQFCGDGLSSIENEPLATEIRTNDTEAESGEQTKSLSPVCHPVLRMLVPANWKLAIPMYAAMGMAVLAKGPIGLILPVASLALFLLLAIRNRDLEQGTLVKPVGPAWRRGFVAIMQTFRLRQVLNVVRNLNVLIGTGIVLAIAMPWYVAVGITTDGVWLREFLLDHNLGRALSPKENHSGFPLYVLYYCIALPLGCFPWTAFLPVALYRMKQRFQESDRFRDSDVLVACWAGVWFLFFSLASTRLPNYLLPAYPAIALIMARYFYEWERDDVDAGVYSFNLCCRATMIGGAIMTPGIMIAAYLLFSGEQYLGPAGIIPVIGAFAATRFLDVENRRRVMQCLTGSALFLTILIVGFAPERIGHYQDSPLFIEKAKQMAAGADINIGTYGYFEPSVVYYAGNQVSILNTPWEVADFLASHPHAFVITPLSRHNELRDVLTGDISEVMRHRNFLHRTELILLGRN